jgi:hypothetical protein
LAASLIGLPPNNFEKNFLIFPGGGNVVIASCLVLPHEGQYFMYGHNFSSQHQLQYGMGAIFAPQDPQNLSELVS